MQTSIKHLKSSASPIVPVFVAVAFLGLPLYVQGQAGTAGEPRLALEEVIVTARKREQSLQDVSLAVTALPESILRDALIGSSEELINLVPSLNLNKGGNARSSSFNIRGIGTTSFSSGIESSVSTMLDGVVMGQSGMAFAQLVDMERVEVLRGPQGTLFGKNASGGLVHFITRDPTQEFEAEVQGFATEDDEYRSSFTVSSGLTENLAARLTGYYNKDEGWIENVFDGNQVNDSDDWGLRGKLLWDVSDELQVKWSSDVSERYSNCCVGVFRSLDPFPATPPNNQAAVDGLLETLLPVVPDEENRLVNLDGDLTTDYKASGHSLEINWDVGSHTLTAISAYRDWEQNARGDNDFLPIASLGFEQGGLSEQEQFSQEIRLTSPADQFVSYVVGLFYLDQTVDRRFDRSFDLTGNNRTEAVADFTVDSLNYALFGEATLNISDTLRLILGARWTYDELEFDFERTGATLGANPEPFFSRDVDEDDLSGKIVVEWDATEDAMLYASFVQGYKGPAFNVGFGSRPDNTDPVSPEVSDAYEIGLKSNWFDKRLVLNVAAFYTEFTDFQASSSQFIPDRDENGNPVDENGDGRDDGVFSFILSNVGEVETKGVEIDFTALVTENLTLFGGLAYVDGEIKEFKGGPCTFGQSFRGIGYLGQTSCSERPAVQDLDGGDLPESPDWKLVLAANYAISLETMPFNLALKGNYRWQDDTQFVVEQDENTVQDAYGILDLSVAFEDKDEHYTVTLFAKNVTDEWHVSYIAAGADTFTPNGYVHQVPRYAERIFGVEGRYRW